MRIKEIQVENFRQYKNINLTFSNATTHDLNYVLAENGIGKTTLLNAITWCLYGRELHITEALKDKTLPLLTLEKLREMNCGDEANTSVALKLEDTLGEVTFTRSIIFRKTEEGTAYEKSRNQKVLEARRDWVPVVMTTEEEFQREVNKRLPFKIQQFFFFDGEQLDTYLANAAGQSVEQTVLQISQIDLLVTMEKNLDSISTELRRTIARMSSKKAETSNAEYEKNKNDLIELETQIKTDKDNLKSAKSKLGGIRNDLEGEPDVAALETERKEIDDKLSKLKDEATTNAYELRYFLKKYLTLLTALPRIKNLYDLIKEKEENKQLPPKYDANELQSMLNECNCFVCGRKLDADATIHIAELLKRFELGQETGTLLTRILGLLQMHIRDAGKYEKERDRITSQQKRIEDETKILADRLREIDNTIDKYTDKERIITLYEKRNDFEKIVDDLTREIAVKEYEFKLLKEKTEESREKLEAAINNNKEIHRMIQQQKLTETGQRKVNEIIVNIKGGIRSQISEEMSNRFFNLMWKKKFSRVEITESYNASVINEDGFECLGSCSAAERELLVLAFTLALHKESGFDGPLVIDTPISRISGDLRVAFAKVLREVSKSKQIILFVTEDEYSENVRDVFEPCANQKYRFELINEDYVKAGEL